MNAGHEWLGVEECTLMMCFFIIMAALRNRAGHYIFALWFLLLPSYFPHLISSVGDVYHTTWCGLGANLECMSEMCCMRLTENTGHKNHFGTIAQVCRAVSSQLRHISTIGKKLVKH